MSIGLIALLDDVAAIARAAAASLDDVASLTAKAGAKAAGVVIDDAAVTPRYVTGFSPARELPIIWRIAKGSAKNKILILLPIALLLSFFAPWAITPLLMLGGAYLAYEGTEKVYEALVPHADHGPEDGAAATLDPQVLEDRTVASAIKTDFILSAEIMAITLAAVPEGSFLMEAVVLAVVGLGITVVVYGAVALIVKADDVGLSLARNHTGALAAFGRGLVSGMPAFLKLLAVVGTAAMIWVGGGILIHGLEEFGIAEPGHTLHEWSVATAAAVPAIGPFLEWLVFAAGSAVVGLLVGAALIPVVSHVIAPLWRRLRPGAAEPAAH